MSDFPVVCIKCHSPNTWKIRRHYEHLLSIGYTKDDALDYLNIKNQCCRIQHTQWTPAIDRLIAPKDDEYNQTLENATRFVSTRFEAIPREIETEGSDIKGNRNILPTVISSVAGDI